MAHIVPLDFSKARPTTPDAQMQSDPFDVVVFLDHFKSIDSLSDRLLEHFEPEEDSANNISAKTSLMFQSSSNQLAITLGRRDS